MGDRSQDSIHPSPAPRPHHLSLDEAVSDVLAGTWRVAAAIGGTILDFTFYRRLSVRLNGDYDANFTSSDLPSKAQIQDC